MPVRIVKLSKKTLAKAIKVGRRVFNGRDSQWLEKVFTESLSRISYNKQKRKEVTSARFWVAKDIKKGVLGTTGLYTHKGDQNEAIWLGWFCVDPDYRGKGLGSRLLDYSIKKAKKEGFDYLRLWTTSSPNEKMAQGLYESRGFRIFDRKKDGRYTTLWRQLKLS